MLSKMHRLLALLFVFLLIAPLCSLQAEEDDNTDERPPVEERPLRRKERKRKYHVVDPERIDAGIFHVGFAAGGNFYTEPKYNPTTKTPTGDYFKDFGFQGGVYFDYDYSALTENVPLGVRGFAGYKYILNSVHVFAFDGIVRRMWQMNDKTSFGIGLGASLAIWYRTETAETTGEEAIFLPSGIVDLGFEFTPFMVDLKWLINRIGSDTTITGVELYFGFRI